MPIADETMLWVLANGLAGDTATGKSLTTTQDEAAIVVREGGAQRGGSGLSGGTTGRVSCGRAGVASGAV